jgi:hypothetical protein
MRDLPTRGILPLLSGLTLAALTCLTVLPQSGATAAEPTAANDSTANHQPAVAGTNLSGCWEGYWQSCKNGHKGPLRATFTCCGEGTYRVEFSGRFWKVFPFRYTATLQATPDEQGVSIYSRQYLGRLFGTFQMTGHADDCSFHANFCSADDRGVFVLKRVSCCR